MRGASCFFSVLKCDLRLAAHKVLATHMMLMRLRSTCIYLPGTIATH